MKRAIALMSGGVDSSVTAALLKEQGYDVIGVYILGWTGTDEFPCSWQDEQADAAAVAKKLGIPFYTVNLSQEYEKEVIDQFFAEYNAGRTPNPDILCNREIKFKHLWQAVRQFEPDYVATGHYAKIVQTSKFKSQNYISIFKPIDQDKDQTYFLWGIDAAMLPKILFPLGDLTKKEVRELAEKYGLPTAKKKDSQGICFVGPLKVRQFLKSQVKHQPGEAVMPDGRVVAKHEGVQLYTIGQRLGAGSVDWTGDVPPLFVAAKDVKNNRLIVGPEPDLSTDEFLVGQANWFMPADKALKCSVKVRYRQPDVPARLTFVNGNLHVLLDEPVRAITPGQSVVFYTPSGKLLGGAIISAVPQQEELVQQIDGKAKTASRLLNTARSKPGSR